MKSGYLEYKMITDNKQRGIYTEQHLDLRVFTYSSLDYLVTCMET